MIITREYSVRAEMLERLRQKYLTEKPLPHLTEVIYCITKSYYERVDKIEPTDKELQLWSVGFGLEDVLLKDKNPALNYILDAIEVVENVEELDKAWMLQVLNHLAEFNPMPGSQQMDDIWLTPDYIELAGHGVDLKTTRMWSNADGSPKNGWPKSWMQQFKAYARLLGDTRYYVSVFYIGAPELVSFKIEFSPEEIESNWAELLERRDAYLTGLLNHEPPYAFAWNEEWECKLCKYRDRCLAM